MIITSTFTYEVILLLSSMIILGLFVGRWFEHFNIPNISGYITLGILFGGLLVYLGYTELNNVFMVITTIAIGFIAFIIGMELDFAKIANRRKEVIIITFFQAMFTSIITAVILWVFGLPLHIALILGTIAIATEPGPILLITKKFKTKGPLTETLVPLHGVEDMISIVLFGLAIAYAYAVESQTPLTVFGLLNGPVFELLFSVGIGVIIGLIFRQIIYLTLYEDPDKDTIVMVTTTVAVLVAIAIAQRGIHLFGLHIHLSPILLPMVVGITFANLSTSKAKHEIEHDVDVFTAPLMIAFFTVIGAEVVILMTQDQLPLGLWLIILYTVLYIGFRVLGKLLGSSVGAVVAKSEPNISKYLGLCLIPQAQAAIGLAFLAQAKLKDYGDYGQLILVVVLIASIIYELFGPWGLKYALIQCDEADSQVCSIMDAQVYKRRQKKHKN